MKSYLPLLSLVMVFASCTTAYKTGQTPDDVYFSPERQRDEYVRTENKPERYYQNDETVREDRYLRMKTQYRRYATLDDYDSYYYNPANYYGYNPNYNYYSYYPNYSYGYNNYYNPKIAYGNNYCYNPYYNNPYFSGNVTQVYSRPRTSNLNIYNGSNGNNSNSSSKSRSFDNSNNNNDNYRGSNTNAGSFLRNTFGGSTNTSHTNNSSSTTTPSSSGSSSSGGSSSGTSTAPVRKF